MQEANATMSDQRLLLVPSSSEDSITKDLVKKEAITLSHVSSFGPPDAMRFTRSSSIENLGRIPPAHFFPSKQQKTAESCSFSGSQSSPDI